MAGAVWARREPPPAAAASADWSSARRWASPCTCCTRTSPPAPAAAACVGGEGGEGDEDAGGGAGEGVGWGAGGGVGALVPSRGGEARGRSLTGPAAPGNIPGARCSSSAPRWRLGNNSGARDQSQCFPGAPQTDAGVLWLLCRTQSETCSSNPPGQIVPFELRLREVYQPLLLL